MKSTLSVLMSNYNHAQYIAEALNAIVSQSFKPFEVLVCDDGSTDNSVEIIQHFVDRYPFVRLVRNDKNMGIFASSDRLTAMASGDYLYYASADDKILLGFFEKSMQLLQEYPQAGLCSTQTLCIDEKGGNKKVLHMPIVSRRSAFVSADKALLMLYRYGSWIQGNTVILRKQALVDSGGFIPELYSFCDGFIYHVIAVKHGVCFIPEVLTAWRQMEGSYSSTIARSSEASLRWITHAKKLMATEYKDLFPLSFIERWEKRELLNYQLSRDFNLQNICLADRLKASKSFFSKGLLRAARIFIKIQYFILKAYRYYRAGLPFEELFIQKLKNFWRSFSM